MDFEKPNHTVLTASFCAHYGRLHVSSMLPLCHFYFFILINSYNKMRAPKELSRLTIFLLNLVPSKEVICLGNSARTNSFHSTIHTLVCGEECFFFLLSYSFLFLMQARFHHWQAITEFSYWEIFAPGIQTGAHSSSAVWQQSCVEKM